MIVGLCGEIPRGRFPCFEESDGYLLSNGDRTATRKESGYNGIFGKEEWTSGIHECDVKLEHFAAATMFA